MGAVAKHSPNQLMLPATKAQQDRLSLYLNRLDPDSAEPGAETFQPGKAPTPGDRAAMKDRLQYLDQRLQPTPSENVDLIKVMRSAFRTYGETEEDAEVQSQVWDIALDDLPAWAVFLAVKKFTQGAVPGQDRRRVPTTAEFCPVAQGLVREYVVEATKLKRILDAPEVLYRLPTQAERDKVMERVAAFKAELAAATLQPMG